MPHGNELEWFNVICICLNRYKCCWNWIRVTVKAWKCNKLQYAIGFVSLKYHKYGIIHTLRKPINDFWLKLLLGGKSIPSSPTCISVKMLWSLLYGIYSPWCFTKLPYTIHTEAAVYTTHSHETICTTRVWGKKPFKSIHCNRLKKSSWRLPNTDFSNLFSPRVSLLPGTGTI